MGRDKMGLLSNSAARRSDLIPEKNKANRKASNKKLSRNSQLKKPFVLPMIGLSG